MTESALTVVLRTEPAGTSVLQVAGDLDHHTAHRLREALDRTPFVPAGSVVVDLAGLTYCDSTGITVLVTAYQRAQSAGSAFGLAAVRPDLMRVLGIIGLDTVFTFHPTAGEAAGPE